MHIVLYLGLVLVAGLLQGSFALPMKRMPAWRWENTWLVYSGAAMVVIPWALLWSTVPHADHVLKQASRTSLVEVALFGFGWGVGSTLFGLGISRVGMAVSFAIVLGITASLGSLLPLMLLRSQQLFTRQGYALAAGLVLMIVGITLCSIAGRRRERELSALQLARGPEFGWGLVICILSGICSPMLNFSFIFGKELQSLTLASGAKPAMASDPIWALALSAGFLANAGYCVYLLQKKRSWNCWAQKGISIRYWLGALIMGMLWFAGIVAYGIGAAGLGALGAVIGWPLFMAMIIIAANFWGAVTGEWKGASPRTYRYSLAGIGALIIAIYVISRGSTA